MKTWVRHIFGLLISLIVLLIVLIIGSVFMLKSSLPKYSGELKLNNLESGVTIYRDQYGIAYIDSKSDLDAYFALGYVHAQERLFQMDLTRRAGEGRLSEIFGNKTLFFDKMFRTIGIKTAAHNNFQKFDETTKNILIAYSNGVNEFIKNSSDKFTIEFDILGYKPELWKPEHSIIITKLMAWELNISWWSDISLTHLIQKLGLEKASDILPNFDENAPTIIPSGFSKYSEIPIEFINIDREFRKFIGAGGTHIGSNNWVVNGDRSLSGKPIIANDPHLAFSQPAKWYIASINSPNLKVDGFTLPGVPGIVIGKNKNISWVLTNVMADDADFYLEKIDSSGSNYYFNDKWHRLEIIFDTINVKDSNSVVFEIRKNHRGPIISDVHTYKKLFHNSNGVSNISMRWSALDYSNELLAFQKVNSAENWNEFREGLQHFYSPGQNFVYADDKGNIGYTAAVRFPKRNFNNPSFIYDGTTDKYDWDGYLKFTQNPKLFNPTIGYIASANNKTIKDYPYHISNVWEPKSRIERITELLNSKEKHSSDDFKNYQNDFYSNFAKDLTPFIVNAFENYEYGNNNVKTAVKLFKHWNFVLNAESQTPTIYAVFFQKILQNIFEDEMGKTLLKEYIFLANIPYRVVPKLLRENKSSWFDNISTEKIETRDDIIRKSLVDAIEFLEKNINPDIEYWQWGNVHKVTFKHFFHGISSLLDRFLDVGPFPIGGDGTTIFNTEYSLTKPFENKLGPSMRFIYDFSNPDVFEFILPTGQSGHFFSDHYNDMTQLWLKGEYISVNTNIDSIKSQNYKKLILIPNI